jgi:hypothetical protein
VSIDRLLGRLGRRRRPERAVVAPSSLAVVSVPPPAHHEPLALPVTSSPGGTLDSAGVVVGSPHSPH